MIELRKGHRNVKNFITQLLKVSKNHEVKNWLDADGLADH